MAYIDTTNMPLHMPVPGTREPAQIALLNENCVVIDAHDHGTGKGLAIGRLRSGLAINRPAAGTPGNIYFSTDTGIFNVDTGTAWVQFLTSGGQATVTGWTLIDPIIRDTLQFGPEGSAAIDAAITRPAANQLRTDNRWGFGVTPVAAQHPDWASVQIGRAMLLRADTTANAVTGVWAANSYYDADGKGHAIVAGSAFQHVLSATNWAVYTAASVAAGAEQVMTARLTMDQAGGLLLNPIAAVNALQVAWPDASFYIARGASTATNTRLYSSHTLEIDPANNYCTPARDGVVSLGAPNFRWGNTHVVGLWSTAPINNNLININNMMDVIADSPGHLRFRRLPSGSTLMRVIYSLPGLYMDEGIRPAVENSLDCGASDGRWRIVYTNQLSSGPGGASLVIGSTGSLQLSYAGYAHPLTDNAMHLGHPSYRFGTIYLASAPVVGSSVELKEDITPLDPAACVASVLETDWVSYVYKPPAFVAPEPAADMAYDEHDSNEAKAEKKAKRDAEEDEARKKHATMVVETASGRRQKGYVLGSPDHKVGTEFGLPDGKSRSDGADIAVVACALQDALRRLAALEARDGNAAAA